jgi:hypothetical protein
MISKPRYWKENPMKTPSFLNGDSPKRLFQGLALGVISAVVIGFGWGGWHLGSTVEEMVDTASETATVAALAPICADKFAKAAAGDSDMIVKLKLVGNWERDAHLMKAGWATFPGGAEPDSKVAEACANMLTKSLKIE